MYCHSAITTVSIEAVDFMAPVKSGNRLETQNGALVKFQDLVEKTAAITLYKSVCCFGFMTLVSDNKRKSKASSWTDRSVGILGRLAPDNLEKSI